MTISIPRTTSLVDTQSAESFACQRIICIGRNYAEHAKEMGHDPQREPPFFFFKPLSAINLSGKLSLPTYSNEVHYELELVLALSGGGKDLNPAQAEACIGGVALGLDMTCRDIQGQAKKQGRPWELAKGFDHSAPITAIGAAGFADLQTLGEMNLLKNGNEVQRGHWQDMLWSPAELLQQVSHYIALQAGDLIFTGTPAGVGPVQAGDRLSGRLQGFSQTLELQITD